MVNYGLRSVQQAKVYCMITITVNTVIADEGVGCRLLWTMPPKDVNRSGFADIEDLNPESRIKESHCKMHVDITLMLSYL